jgi:hypothetical protein
VIEMEILPFPLSRRCDLINRQAAWFAEQNHHAAEASLRRLLQIQRETLNRRGVDQARIDAECRALEEAIRRRVALVMHIPGGAA